MKSEFDVVDVTSELLRFDTSNYGTRMGPDVAACVAYLEDKVRAAGFEPFTVGPSEDYLSIVVKVPGDNPDGKAPVIIHGHYDVVPADATNWSVHPFGGEVRDDQLWGRGAVDMKNMVAMMLSALKGRGEGSLRTDRDLVFVFFADEEAGGARGGQWMVDNHPELFEGASFAMSEVGGFSITVGGQRRYLLQTAEKGFSWMNITATGRAGHGSVPNDDNAVAKLVQALERLSTHEWQEDLIPSVDSLLDGVAEALGVSRDEVDTEYLVSKLGGAEGFVRGVLRDTAQLTVLNAGEKGNVIPDVARATIDCRFLPGHEEEFLAKVRELLGPDVELDLSATRPALEAPWDHEAVEVMRAVVQELDDGSDVLPYCLSGGTDNKALSRLGIPGYGFVPLQLPEDFNFAGMFHGVDERVPVSSIRFGEKALLRLIELL